ncbi:AAA family ATPase [Burkholderia sp. AU45388]|uniref:AAA family ATPase n=1 Tax=Burkholderia sp. AU45388 TaxID=3059206 RepID=UPI0026519F62|nr:AAA family ATPase [Burkholderia sp. AU45388]MDN7426052.1 hypothetical protein [Burkholderia sp. AU45388]
MDGQSARWCDVAMTAMVPYAVVVCYRLERPGAIVGISANGRAAFDALAAVLRRMAAPRAWGHSLFQAVGCEHRLHYLDVSDEICKSRLLLRNMSGEHPFQTSEEQYDQITRYFVPPALGEGFNIIIYDETGKVRFRTGS